MKPITKFKIIAAWVAFALAYTLLGSGRAHAGDSVACYNVNDQDARTYCLARAHHEPSQCYSIQQAYLRSQCLADVRQ